MRFFILDQLLISLTDIFYPEKEENTESVKATQKDCKSVLCVEQEFTTFSD